MLRNESSGVQKFVSTKNAANDGTRPMHAPGGKTSMDDLKVKPSKASTAANSQQPRSKSQSAHPSAHTKTESGSHNVQQQGRRESTEQRHFYDTDASSIGKSSTTASVQGSTKVAAQPRRQQQVANGRQDEQEQASSSRSEEGGSSESEDLPEVTVGGVTGKELSTKQQFMMKNIDAEIRRQTDGRNLPYVKGDSYPTTTSGRPSEAGVDYQIDNRSDQHHKPQAAPSNVLPTRESFHRQQLGGGSAHRDAHAHQPAEATHVVQQPTASGRLVRQDGGDLASLERDTAASFVFTKTPTQKVSARPAPHTRQQSGPESAVPKVPISNNTAQRASVPSHAETTGQFQKKQRASGTKREDLVTGPQPHWPRPQSNFYQATKAEQPVIEPAPDYEQFSDFEPDMHNGSRTHGHAEGQSEGREVQLDYEAPALFNMEYQDLKGQSLDVDPNAKDFKLPVDQQNDAIQSKLSTVATLQPQDQFNFFTSLSLDEWEQAGEWFLDRFGEVVGKLKNARQEKRKAARLFEDEIESRYTAVGKKRKQLDESLNEMKESGGKVLQGTPKKTKTK